MQKKPPYHFGCLQISWASAGKIVFILVATLEPSLNYLVAKFNNLVANSTTDNIHIMIAGRILGRQIGHQKLKVSHHRLTDGRQMRLGNRIFPALNIFIAMLCLQLKS